MKEPARCTANTATTLLRVLTRLGRVLKELPLHKDLSTSQSKFVHHVKSEQMNQLQRCKTHLSVFLRFTLVVICLSKTNSFQQSHQSRKLFYHDSSCSISILNAVSGDQISPKPEAINGSGDNGSASERASREVEMGIFGDSKKQRSSPPPTLLEGNKAPPDEAVTEGRLREIVDGLRSIWRKFRGGGNKDDANRTIETKKKMKSSLPSVMQKLVQRLGDSGETWVTVFPKTRISPGEMVPVTVDGVDLLVIASNDGKKRLYCIENSCPHLGTPLELGQLVRLPRVDDLTKRNDEFDVQMITDQTTATTTSLSLFPSKRTAWTEFQVSSILQQDGCEDCIVCPLHKTAFALESGQPRGEWCPYPPVVGKLVGRLQKPRPAPVFDVRVRGKQVQVRMNSVINADDITSQSETKKQQQFTTKP